MTLICNNCRNAYCREPVDGRFEPCSVLASPKRCLFCGETGVHNCEGGVVPGGYRSRRDRFEGTGSTRFSTLNIVSECWYPGKIDADAMYAMPEIDP